MANGVAEAGPRSTGRSVWLAAVLLALVLLATGAIWAHFPPISQADGMEEFLSESAGYKLFISGAMPWLLQWSGLALLVVAVARARFRVRWADVLLGVCLPLAVGLIWWVGLCATYWTKNPLEAVAEHLMWAWTREYGADSLWQVMLFEVFGPLAHPLRQQGPGNLRGWEFLWTSVSTAVVMSTLTWVGWRLRVEGARPDRGARRRWLLMFLWTALYISPVFVRALTRVVSALDDQAAACW
jgi:hypothetical protein